jgi:hypothetical protein
MNHAEHEWAKEQMAAHIAGGLPADERARLEAHAASCAECIAEGDEIRRFDRRMDELFRPIRPGAGLEQRILKALRTDPPQMKSRSLASRVFRAVAAVVLIGVLGAVIIQMDGRETETVAVQEARLPESRKSAAGPMTGADFAGPTGGVPMRGEKGETRKGDSMADDPVVRRAHEGAEMHAHFTLDHDAHDLPVSVDELGSPAPVKAPPPTALVLTTPPSAPGQGGGQGRMVANELERLAEDQKTVLSYRVDRRSGGKPADPGYFNPVNGSPEPMPKRKSVVDGSKPESKLAAAPERSKVEGAAKEFKQAQAGEGQTGRTAQDPQPPQAYQRKIIRTGEVEYEVDSFDSSVATISKLVEEESGFLATVNSDKLPNGKVRGTVVLRVPPERLDLLLLKLRGLGELKTQNIRSQEVGKQYYDLESRLKAARTMEERLLRIIKEGKGEIKDLLLAERELGEWRTKIEGYEGEKRYYDNQIALSTLTLTLTEKEIRSPFAVTQTERVNLGLEVEDVEKAHRDALAAVAEAKGRVTKSELNQLAAGQYSATLHFEVSPAASGPLQDRFKQLGTVARLNIDRVEETEGGSGKVGDVLKVKQKDTQFFVSIYNLANVAPRETNVVSLACVDAEAAYKAILDRIEKAAGRVVTSTLNRQRNEQTSGEIRFEIKTAEAAAVLQDVRAAGEVMRLDVVENPDTQSVTKSKRGFQVMLYAMGLVEPRETVTIQLASKDVSESYARLQEALATGAARVLVSQLNETDRQNVTATLSFDLRRDQGGKVDAALAAAGEVLSRSVTRAQDVERVVDSKKRFSLTLVNVANIHPRETYTIGVEADPVDSAVALVEKLASEVHGRIIDSRHTRAAGGRDVSKITLDLPLAQARAAADRIRGLGTVRVFDATRNPQAPEGELSVGRLDITLMNPQELVDADSGPWARIKGGLSVGLTALSWSLTLVIVGLCFVVPVGGMIWGGVLVYRKVKSKPV